MADSYQQSLLAGIHGGDPRLAHLAQYGDNANFYGGALGNSLFQNRINGYTAPVDLSVLSSHPGSEILSEFRNWANSSGQNADQMYNTYLQDMPGTIDPNKNYLTYNMSNGFIPATQGGTLHELASGYSANFAGKEQIREGELDNAMNRISDLLGPNASKADWSKLIEYDPNIGLYTDRGAIQHVNDAGMDVVQQRIVPVMQAVTAAMTGNAIGNYVGTLGSTGSAAAGAGEASTATAGSSSSGLGASVAKGVGTNAMSTLLKGGTVAAATKAGGGMANQSYGSTMGGTVYDPFESYRHYFGDRLSGMASGKEDFSGDPSYQFRFNQGQQAVERSMAARGMLGSGNELMELQKYGQDMASQEWGNEFNRLATLSGANSLMGSGLGQLNMQRQMNTMQGVGGLLGSIFGGSSSGSMLGGVGSSGMGWLSDMMDSGGSMSGFGDWIVSMFGA